MSSMSKYHKLIFGCSAIATASFSGLVQPASAAEQFATQTVRADRDTILLAGVFNGSNQPPIPTPPIIPTPPTPVGDSNQPTTPTIPVKPPVADSNQPTTPTIPVADSNQPTTPTIPVKPPVADSNQPTTPVVPVNGSDGNAPIGGNGGSGSSERVFSASSIARSQALGSRLSLASGKYSAALAALAAAEAAQTNASSKTSPVRYGREVADASTCGCLNSDTASAGTLSPEMVAAKQVEADAAAELAAAKAEARTFLESVKSEPVASNADVTIW